MNNTRITKETLDLVKEKIINSITPLFNGSTDKINNIDIDVCSDKICINFTCNTKDRNTLISELI